MSEHQRDEMYGGASADAAFLLVLQCVQAAAWEELMTAVEAEAASHILKARGRYARRRLGAAWRSATSGTRLRRLGAPPCALRRHWYSSARANRAVHLHRGRTQDCAPSLPYDQTSVGPPTPLFRSADGAARRVLLPRSYYNSGRYRNVGQTRLRTTSGTLNGWPKR